MKQRFYSDQDLLESITKRFNFGLLADIGTILIVALFAAFSEDFRELLTDWFEIWLGKIIFVCFALLIVRDIWVLMRLNAVRTNINQCWLEINDSVVSGYTSNMLDLSGSVRYFEFTITDFRSASVMEWSLKEREYFTLMISYSGGTVFLPIENASRIKKLLEDRKKECEAKSV